METPLGAAGGVQGSPSRIAVHIGTPALYNYSAAGQKKTN